jgi:hypothetical protein
MALIAWCGHALIFGVVGRALASAGGMTTDVRRPLSQVASPAALVGSSAGDG